MKTKIRIFILSLIGILSILAGQLETSPNTVAPGSEITWEISKAKTVRSFCFEIVETEIITS